MAGRKRNAFTLVELLIVVAIITTLSTTLTMSMQGSTAKAKAAVIASNVEACKNAAALCLVNSEPKELNDKTANYALRLYMPKWADYADSTSRDAIIYKASGTGSEQWVLTVDFRNDPEKTDIKSFLQRIKGYNKYFDANGDIQDVMGNNYWFKVELISGKIVASNDVVAGDTPSGS